LQESTKINFFSTKLVSS